MITIRHEHFFHFENGEARALVSIDQQLAHLTTLITNTIMATQTEIVAQLNETLKEVKANTDLINGLDVLIQGLSDQLAAALKAAGASAEVLQAAQDVMSAVSDQKAAIVAATNVNTPAETPQDVTDAAHL